MHRGRLRRPLQRTFSVLFFLFPISHFLFLVSSSLALSYTALSDKARSRPGPEGGVKMKRILWLVALVLVTLAVGFGVGVKAAAKSYQFTGTVESNDGGILTVKKSATETWTFSTDASTKGTGKAGDKVTVYYKMVATEIEAKPAAAAPKKK